MKQGTKKNNSAKNRTDRKRLAEYLGYLPKFMRLIVNLLRDPRVSATDKAILGATVAYVLNPVDLVPDWIPFLGMVDDIYLVVLALLRMVLRTEEEVLLNHWDGPQDLILLLRNTAHWAVGFLPKKIQDALIARIDNDENKGNHDQRS